MEYRFNFITDTLLQPIATSLIEMALWIAVFASATTDTIGGFGKEAYLAYALWAAFIGRIATSWMYEFRMIEEIESGTINSILVRPISFYNYYLSQLLGYKFITTVVSLLAPLTMMYIFKLPFYLERLPLALCLTMYYLILVHSMSFVISTVAFHFNRIHSLTMAKNLGLWLLSGELIPLDLIPSPFKEFIMNLPFSNAVYGPVSYITGRAGIEVIQKGFVTTTMGILFFSIVGKMFWNWGIQKYSGTGA